MKITKDWEEVFDDRFSDISHFDCPEIKEGIPCATMKKDVKSFIRTLLTSSTTEYKARLKYKIQELINKESGTDDYSAGKMRAFDEVWNMVNDEVFGIS